MVLHSLKSSHRGHWGGKDHCYHRDEWSSFLYHCHFGGDIVRPKIRSIVNYVKGSSKLTSQRAYLSYEDFVTLLEETSKIYREDCKGLSTTKVGGPLRHNSFPNHKPEYKDYPETNGRRLDPRRFGPFVDDDDVPQSNDSFKTIRTDVPPSNEPSIPQSNVYLSNEHVLTNVSQSNEPFQTIPTDALLSNEPCIFTIKYSSLK
ncbi:hypothetical protein GIB67_027290 [Kingdonia uniflora]|uniref:Uncharacterized protein n=1 Tax=Kingdonia uniflora TaxID=39325 RepID=A0A7J7KYG9_9MAGN|nr:hypothetical protein GIB67_027290 [Kingdonia uniflora]